MAKLFKCGRSSCSRLSSSHTLDNNEYDKVEKGKDLLTWNIPTLPTSKIYKTNLLTHISSHSSLIITKQKNCSLSHGGGCLNLFCGADLWVKECNYAWLLSNKYHSIHIGMVQIGVKALTRKPLNAKVLLCLRDARHSNLQDSLLGMVEANLRDGPFYFNVFPNIVESLFDSDLDNMLFLSAEVRDFELLPEGPNNIVLMYRVCYKAIKLGFKTRALLESPPNGKTVFFQNDNGSSNNKNVLDQRVTVWDEVQLPENWPPPPPGPDRTRVEFQ